MYKGNSHKNNTRMAPANLLERADFLNQLGVPRAALVLYDWAIFLAPRDPIALAGQAKTRRLTIEAEAVRN